MRYKFLSILLAVSLLAGGCSEDKPEQPEQPQPEQPAEPPTPEEPDEPDNPEPENPTYADSFSPENSPSQPMEDRQSIRRKTT